MTALLALAIIAACLTTVAVARWRWTFERGHADGWADRERAERWERRTHRDAEGLG